MKRIYEIQESSGERKFFRTFKNLLHYYRAFDDKEYNKLYQRFRYNDWYLKFEFGEVWRRDLIDGT